MHVIIRFAREGMTRDLANQFRDHFTARLEQEGVPGPVFVAETDTGYNIVLDREPEPGIAVTVADLIRLASLAAAGPRTGTPTSLSPGEVALFVSLLQEHDRRRVDQSIDRVRALLSPQGRRVAAVLFGDAVSDAETDREVEFLHRQVVLETKTVRNTAHR